jgi:hypothetical protein
MIAELDLRDPLPTRTPDQLEVYPEPEDFYPLCWCGNEIFDNDIICTSHADHYEIRRVQ